MPKLSIQTSLLVCFKQRAHPLSTILKGHASSYITITTRAENRVMNDHHFSLKFNNGQTQCNFRSKSRNWSEVANNNKALKVELLGVVKVW